ARARHGRRRAPRQCLARRAARVATSGARRTRARRRGERRHGRSRVTAAWSRGLVAEKPQARGADSPHRGSVATPIPRTPPPRRLEAQARVDTRSTRPRRKQPVMRKFFELGGIVAATILIVFGVVSIAMGFNGRSTVRDSLKQEQIVGTPDMTPSAIAAEAKKAGLPASIQLPTTDIAGKAIVTGQLARDFASYMRIHTLEATGGQTYAQMPRFATADGKGTNDAAQAAKSPSGQPLDNPVRNVWVTETALSTALNTSFMAE